MTPSATASSPAHGKQAKQAVVLVGGSEAQIGALVLEYRWRG